MFIYGLFDPRTGAIRYIGQATDAERRLKRHHSDSRSLDRPIHRWIRELDQLGLLPILRTFERVADEDGDEAERKAIAGARVVGMADLNVADGGAGPSCPTDVRAANGRKVARAIHDDPYRKRLWELKQKLGRALEKGWVREETKARMRQAAIDRPDIFGSWKDI